MLIVHDFAYVYGGAERVTETMAEAFPQAEVVLIGAHREVVERMGVADRSRTLLPWGRFEGGYRALAPILPRLVGAVRDEVVLSSSYAFAHHARGDLHVEYCHSPLRQVWIAQDRYEATMSPLKRALFAPMASSLRRKDLAAVARVHALVASCENVRQRIEKIYEREASVVYPPVDTSRFGPPAEPRIPNRLVMATRLVEPYKGIRHAFAAVAGLDCELVIAGTGRDEAELRAEAPPNVRFVGQLRDDELARHYGTAAAVLFPSEDDFGIVPIEAMACGTPVVALDAGGARETVVDGETGIRFPAGGLRPAIEIALSRDWDHEAIRAHSERFGRDRFLDEIRAAMAQWGVRA